MGGIHCKPEFPPLLLGGFHRWDMARATAELVTASRFLGISVTRPKVMGGLKTLIAHLNKHGIVGELWLDGSFLTEKIDPSDVDTLLHVPADDYDSDPRIRATIDWASHADRLLTHFCDAYKWVEYKSGHPLFGDSEADRDYWTGWYGKSERGRVPKGIVVIKLPATL